MPPFDINSRRSTPEIVQNSASKVANWIIVDILKYLYECYVIITGKLLLTHFYWRLPKITNLPLQYFTYFLSIGQ